LKIEEFNQENYLIFNFPNKNISKILNHNYENKAFDLSKKNRVKLDDNKKEIQKINQITITLIMKILI